MASVDHPTLLCCRGYVPIESGTPAIVTDYARQGSFDKLLKGLIKGETVPGYDDTARLKILYGIAVGMMILHMQRIIHRDLKPDNILLNEQLEPLVADFGLSKIVEKGKTKLQSICCGTPIFMAPEIFEGGCDFDFAVDVYAYGILLYIAIAKCEVDYGPGAVNEYAIGHRVLAGKRPTIPPDTDPAWRDLIEACWAQGRELRPTFEQIVVALGSPTFVTDGINAVQFREYQNRIMPGGSPPVTFSLSAGPLNGIIAYLTIKCGGNVHDRGCVTITSSPPFNEEWPECAAKNVVDLADKSSFMSAVRTGDIPHSRNNWLCFDFNTSRIAPSHYTLRTRFDREDANMASWILEGSADGSCWVELHRQERSGELNGKSVTRSYAVFNAGEYRFLRIVNVGRNLAGNDQMALSAVEFFGSLAE
jgi:hypothetical protein